MQDLTPRPLDAANPHPLTGRGNVTWLIDGAAPALVDAGIGRDSHLDQLVTALGDRPLQHIYVTHHHADHASGVPAIRQRWPQVLAWKFPDDTPGDWRPLADGDVVTAGDTQLHVLHTPGHAADHVCFWHPASRSLFGGDMVVLGTTIMIPASRGGSLRQYLQSLQRLAALEPARIYPGHGPIIDRPVDLIREYIEHRMLRDRQVRDCLARGLVTVDAIADRIYPGLAPALRGAAEETVRAHLQMIHDDDR